MTTTPFDTLKLATKLEQAGFTSDQAKGASTALAEALSDEMVMKSYLGARLKDLQLKILRWLVVTQIALAGFIFAAIKFVK